MSWCKKVNGTEDTYVCSFQVHSRTTATWLTLNSIRVSFCQVRKWETKHSIVRRFMKLASSAAKRPLWAQALWREQGWNGKASGTTAVSIQDAYGRWIWLCSKNSEDFPNDPKSNTSPSAISPIFPWHRDLTALPMPRVAPVMMATWWGGSLYCRMEK